MNSFPTASKTSLSRLNSNSNKAVLRRLTADSQKRTIAAARQRVESKARIGLVLGFFRLGVRRVVAFMQSNSVSYVLYVFDAFRWVCFEARAFFASLFTYRRRHAAVALAKNACGLFILVGISTIGYGTITDSGLHEPYLAYQADGYREIYSQGIAHFHEPFEFSEDVNSEIIEEYEVEVVEAAEEILVEEDVTEAVFALGAGCVDNVLVQEGKRYYTAEELQRGLLRELVVLAPAFVSAQEEHGIDAVFLAAIAALESGWGSYPIHGTNLFGFGNMRFESREAGVDHVARFLRKAYLTEGGQYYRGVSVVNVGHHYCPVPSSRWPAKISQIMGEIIARIDK